MEEKKLIIFTAGVMMGLVKQKAEEWNVLHPDVLAVVYPGGSVDLASRILNGERCDILITADAENIPQMLMPEYASGYQIFSGNAMVILAAPGRDISSDNWKEKMLDPDAKFLHLDPYGDPVGYRAVMAMKLADYAEPGLGEKLMNHPGHLGMDKKVHLNMKQLPEHDYMITYRSAAVKQERPYAELPDEMNLSQERLRKLYEKASFEIAPGRTVSGAPILHAGTILKNCPHQKEARLFWEQFLETDFTAHGFSKCEKKIGLF